MLLEVWQDYGRFGEVQLHKWICASGVAQAQFLLGSHKFSYPADFVPRAIDASYDPALPLEWLSSDGSYRFKVSYVTEEMWMHF